MPSKFKTPLERRSSEKVRPVITNEKYKELEKRTSDLNSQITPIARNNFILQELLRSSIPDTLTRLERNLCLSASIRDRLKFLQERLALNSPHPQQPPKAPPSSPVGGAIPLPTPTYSPTTVALQSNASSTKPFTGELVWGGLKYKVEQDLPSGTTQEDWLAIVNAYAQLLNATENSAECHPGINQLQLSLDTNKSEMKIIIPTDKGESRARSQTSTPTTIIIQNPIVLDLCTYQKTHERSNLRMYRSEDLLPEAEEILLAPLGLTNTSASRCATNTLLQMILTYPRLRDQIQTTANNDTLTAIFNQYSVDQQEKAEISQINTTLLEDLIFPEPSEAQSQYMDVAEALQGLVDLGGSLRNRLTIDHITTQTFLPLDAMRDLKGSDTHYETIQENKLPILSLNPNPKKSLTLSEAIKEQKQSWEKPHGHIRTIDVTNPKDPKSFIVHKLEGELTQFASAPNTLFIHTNRIGSTPQELNTGKITLSQKLFLPGVLTSNPSGGTHYQLRSFSAYEGQDTSHGHFVAYVKIKGEDKKTHYYKLDDSSRSEISETTFLKASENFTLAFYDNISNPITDPISPAFRQASSARRTTQLRVSEVCLDKEVL